MALTILSVAYPLAPVGPDGVGGAEQVLTYLDSALVRAGHQSIVVACEGSQTAGTLFPIHISGASLAEILESTDAQQRAAIQQILREYPVDVVHMHSLNFVKYLPVEEVPVVATLHLPPAYYPPEIFSRDGRSNSICRVFATGDQQYFDLYRRLATATEAGERAA